MIISCAALLTPEISPNTMMNHKRNSNNNIVVKKQYQKHDNIYDAILIVVSALGNKLKTSKQYCRKTTLKTILTN